MLSVGEEPPLPPSTAWGGWEGEGELLYQAGGSGVSFEWLSEWAECEVMGRSK